MCSQSVFWEFNQEGLLEECVHPGVDGEGRRTQIMEGAILEKRLKKTDH